MEVSTCTSGQKAREILHRNIFDLVITDLEMPNGDGALVASTISKLHEPPFLIVFTGQEDEARLEEVKSFSNNDWFLGIVKKPNFVELKRRVFAQAQVTQERKLK